MFIHLLSIEHTQNTLFYNLLFTSSVAAFTLPLATSAVPLAWPLSSSAVADAFLPTMLSLTFVPVEAVKLLAIVIQ